MSDIRPYSGVAILDLTHHYGTYAGKLFADLGAEVTIVERAAQDYFDVFNSLNKRRLEGGDANETALRELASKADIVLLEKGGPLSDAWTEIARDNPKAVVTVVSPFGTDGPWADKPATDLTLQAAGGIAWLSGTIDEAPLRLPFEQSVPISSVYAAVITAIAFWDAEATGSGHIIDISVQECIAHSLQNAIQVYDLEDRISMRGGEGTRDCSEDRFPCADGYVFTVVSPMLGAMWKTFVAWINEVAPEVGVRLSADKWMDRPWRTTQEAKDEYRSLIEPVFQNMTRLELRAVALERRLILVPVATLSSLFIDDQLSVSKYFQSVISPLTNQPILVPGAPYRLSEPVWQVAPNVLK